jgi:hypothetical protein
MDQKLTHMVLRNYGNYESSCFYILSLVEYIIMLLNFFHADDNVRETNDSGDSILDEGHEKQQAS